GKTLPVTLPADLKAGNYLFRSEIIALHLADKKGGAEFYPGCAQLQVTGDGAGVPASTVALPGAYSDTDPGIFDPSVFDQGAKYTFPGPALSNLVASTANATSSGS
ncbi:glycosyl hydrolase family 61-domain-containing protein, partial [Amylostereum chailletii]